MKEYANHYTWLWKKTCLRNRDKVFEKLSVLIDSMNTSVLSFLGIKLEKRNEYAIYYVTELLEKYQTATTLDITKFVSGIGHRKSIHQRQYQKMRDYMGNDQLLPAYNLQVE